MRSVLHQIDRENPAGQCLNLNGGEIEPGLVQTSVDVRLLRRSGLGVHGADAEHRTMRVGHDRAAAEIHVTRRHDDRAAELSYDGGGLVTIFDGKPNRPGGKLTLPGAVGTARSQHAPDGAEGDGGRFRCLRPGSTPHPNTDR